MNEKRRVCPDIADAVELEAGASPRRPRGDGQRVACGAEAQQINHHQFAISVPPGMEEAVFRRPAHGERLFVLQHPQPIDALKDSRGQLVDFGVVEIGAAC